MNLRPLPSRMTSTTAVTSGTNTSRSAGSVVSCYARSASARAASAHSVRSASTHVASASRATSYHSIYTRPENQEQQVRVRVSIGSTDRDIFIPVDIMVGAFLKVVCMEMGVQPTVAEFGWKLSNEILLLPPRELKTQVQLEDAIEAMLRLQSGSRRLKVIALVVVHLNYHGLAYRSQMLLLDRKFSCANHPHRWCYVRPGSETPDDHQGLGEEELHIWAKRMYDGLADPTGKVPPDCFDWQRDRASYGGIAGKKTIYNHDDQSEALTLQSVLQVLNTKYPLLNFYQYQDCLTKRGIVYAVNALHFDHQYYMALGMSEGAIGTFLEEVEKAFKSDVLGKPGVGNREPSVAAMSIIT
ncbi:hypothetical protein BJ165DRAFT_1398192 [Panaeolus papilionaceus]|nr:hypothetical protein BJ165DRAFT_1398192 [Panaeolus papilionaceus]